MNLYSKFQRQSKQDLISAKKLYDIKDYGNAVFLSQQALEKAFKYIMMKYELVDQNTEALKHLNHRPILALIDKQIEYTEKFEPKNKAEELIKSTVQSALPILDRLFTKKSKIVSDVTWWQISLGIDLPAEEEEKVQIWVKKHLKTFLEILQQIKNIILKINNNKNEQINEIINKMHIDLKTCQDKLNNFTGLKIKECFEEQQKAEHILRGLLPLVHNNRQHDKKLVGIVTISLWVVSHSSTLFKIAPHEDLGRYPTEIIGSDSLLLYRQNAKHLFSFIKEVEIATKNIFKL